MFEFSLKFGKEKKKSSFINGSTFYPINNNQIPKYDKSTLITLSESIADVYGILKYISLKASSLEIKHYRELSNGTLKDLGNTEHLNLLYHPNKQFTKESYFDWCVMNLLVTGQIPIQKINTNSFGVTSLYPMPSDKVYPIPQYCSDIYGTPMLNVNPIDNPVVKYNYHLEGGKIEVLPVEDVIFIKDCSSNLKGVNYFQGKGYLISAINSIESLKFLYQTINTILSKRGALGFITRTTAAGVQDTILTQEEKTAIEEEYYSKYGTTEGKKPFAIMPSNLNFIKTDSGLNEFIPIELKLTELESIANCLCGFPLQLINGSKNATYNNVKEAQKAFITNIVKPNMSIILSAHTKGLNLPSNEFFEVDYSLEESMQVDENLLNQTKKLQSDYYFGLLDKGLVTKEYVNKELGLPEPPKEDLTVNEPNNKENATQTV